MAQAERKGKKRKPTTQTLRASKPRRRSKVRAFFASLWRITFAVVVASPLMLAGMMLLLVAWELPGEDGRLPDSMPQSAPILTFSPAAFLDGTTEKRAVAAVSPQTVREAARLVWPTLSDYVTSRFGRRVDPVAGVHKASHRGIDIRSDHGEPVVAAADGEVVYATRSERGGLAVRIAHGEETATVYAHLSKIMVRKGERVVAGQVIGHTGATGRVTGPHLHFELWHRGRPRNPLTFDWQHRNEELPSPSADASAAHGHGRLELASVR